jgi:hypothetical protein
MQASTEISTPASADSTLTSDSHETSLPVLGMADSATTDEPATSTHGKDDGSNDDFALTTASSELPPSGEEEPADDELVFHAPSTVPSAPVSSSVPSLRSRSRQQVLSRGRDTVAPEQPRRNAPRKLDGFSSTNSNNNINIHSVEGESNAGNVAPSLDAGMRPGISLEQNLFQEVQQSIAAAEPVRTFVGRPLRPVVAPAGVESSAVQSSRSRSRASTPAPTPVELPPSPPPRRPALSRPAPDEEGAAVAAPGGGEYEYEYYYDYLDDSPHSTDYDLVPLSAKVTLTTTVYFYFYFLFIYVRYRDVG